MKKLNYRKAVFIVVYKKENSKLKYLLLKRKLHWKGWEFPKGGIEKKESKALAVKRELKEETHLKPLKVISYRKKGNYKYDEKTKAERGYHGQTYTLYSIEVKSGRTIFDKKEHSGFKWVDFSSALKLLTWKNQRICLKIVNEKIKSLH